jgi:hypothetical protein
MKIKRAILLSVILVLSACTAKPSQSTPVKKWSTRTPDPNATVANTPLPLGTPTITLTPEPGVPSFFKGLAPSADQFSPVQRTDLLRILIYLRTQPSLIASTAPAAKPAKIVEGGSGNSWFTVTCASNGQLGCAVAASVRINDDQGNPIYLLIWEVKNGDGTSGFIVNDILQITGRQADWFKEFQANPGKIQTLSFVVANSEKYANQNTFTTSVLKQQGYREAIQKWIDTGNVPSEMDSFILPNGWSKNK